ncbi:unnamed protein product [Darwinula stevensoni]|uniref:Peptidase S1 domain-containing protein n=1 Tax=Darwinula stevensoni TaxID=69355 RepID=A0A7R8XCF4_9CRUS|nr:unnamed protein product [Darwinula stevensoni]CAG0893270.1 unnamed protein product [Darwinula stevensoni]
MAACNGSPRETTTTIMRNLDDPLERAILSPHQHELPSKLPFRALLHLDVSMPREYDPPMLSFPTAVDHNVRGVRLHLQRPMCASSTELQNPVNVGNYLTAVLYSVAYSSRGFECTVTCGSSAPITTPAPTPPANPCRALNGEALNDRCGISQGSKRLLGGIPVTDQGKYPWMVHITDPSRTLFFGGSLINDRYVLTSAFQVQQSASTTMYVTLGDLDVSTSTESTSIEVQATSILHPHFDITTYRNNIALLKLVTPVDFTAYPNIRPICISADADPAPGTQVSIAGWGGNVSSSAPVPVMTMQEAIVQVLDTAACQTQFTQVDQSFICTQPLANAVTNICTGDMGGPLMYQNPGGYIQNVGVASFSLCYPGYLYWTTGVFTRTSKYVDDFIDSNTSDAIWCPAP